MNNFKIQVPKEHYKEDYDDTQRFISYSYQINLIKQLRPKNILEIGVGNKTVSNYLKNNGFDIKTCDFDEKLEPDYVGDVRSLPIEDNSFDVVVSFQTLEHLPWEEFEKCLLEMKRVSRKNVIISLPYSSYNFEFILKFPFIRSLTKRKFIDVLLRIPLPYFRKNRFDGQHYWEIGWKNYSKKKIKNILKKHFYIKKELTPTLNPFHYFFVLENKN